MALFMSKCAFKAWLSFERIQFLFDLCPCTIVNKQTAFSQIIKSAEEPACYETLSLLVGQLVAERIAGLSTGPDYRCGNTQEPDVPENAG